MSTTKTIVRKARELSTRSLLDVTSKVKAAAIASAGTDLAAAGAYLHGTIGLHALGAIAVASLVPVVAAYGKTTSERVEEDVDAAVKVVKAAGAVVAAVAPEAKPVVDIVEDGVATVQAMVDAASTPAEVAPQPAEITPTTETIALGAPLPATAGGQ